MVNHDAPHQLRGHCDKVAPALPDRLRIIDQSQVGLVENCGGLQRVAGALPAHVMVGEPVQFGLHQREQFLQRSLVSAAPVAEQLRDLLSRGWGPRHTSCSTPQILTQSTDFYSTAGGDQKKLRSRGGFQPAFPLYQDEPAQQQTRRKNQNRKQISNKKNLCKLNNPKTTQPLADAERYRRWKLQIPPSRLARDIRSCWRSPALV